MRRVARFSFVGLVAAAALALDAPAQQLIYSAQEIRAQVVDADSGAPLDGVIVVARWEWLSYRPTLHGSPYVNGGDVLRSSETLTDRSGRFEIPGWTGLSKGAGVLDDHADPQISLFKSGYEPTHLRNSGWTDYMRPNPAAMRTSEWNGKTIALRRFSGSPREYAQRIAQFQGEHRGGLWWREGRESWKSMPQMILALHREKRRLEGDGAPILGVNLMPGRSGAGTLVDAQTGAPVGGAVISITWTLRREGGTQTRQWIQQKRSGVEGSSATFYVSPWRFPAPGLPGWEVAYDRAPLVRVYAPGYRRTPDVSWEESGGMLQVQRRPATREALLEELREWRGDIDAALAQAPDRQEALESQQFLIMYLVDQCRTLTADLHSGVCFERDSDVVRYSQARNTGRFVLETHQDSREIRVVGRTGSALQAVAISGDNGSSQSFGIVARAPPPLRAPSVRGFSIEPK